MKTVSRIAPAALRILYGLAFAAAGAVGLFQLAPTPPQAGVAGTFVAGLAAAGYFLPLLKATELFAGLLLLSGRWVPFALTLLAPIVVNIAAFHFLLEPAGAPVAAVLLVAEAGLAWMYRDAFAPLFRRAPVKSPSAEVSRRTTTLDVQAGAA
jgi:uncharacterized membrane protein YphA (DoxX/SURF4 family)